MSPIPFRLVPLYINQINQSLNSESVSVAHGMMAGVAAAGAAAYGAHHMGHGGGHYPAPGTAQYGHYDHGKHGKGHGKFKHGKGKGKYKQGKFGKNHGGKFKKWK